MAYEKYIPERGGRGSMFLTPYVTINKGGMSFNRYVKEMIGEKFKHIVFYFDKESSKIGLWFWRILVRAATRSSGSKTARPLA